MDELFLLPSAPVAMPRAYWLKQFFLSSQLVVIEPSEKEYNRIEQAMINHEVSDYDMDILNNMYNDSCLVIPHRRYDMLTSEFRAKDHVNYLGSDKEIWSPREELENAKYVHFSDWPLPKPWITASETEKKKTQPDCGNGLGREECPELDIWLGLYENFTMRREVISIQKKNLSSGAKLTIW